MHLEEKIISKKWQDYENYFLKMNIFLLFRRTDFVKISAKLNF